MPWRVGGGGAPFQLSGGFDPGSVWAPLSPPSSGTRTAPMTRSWGFQKALIPSSGSTKPHAGDRSLAGLGLDFNSCLAPSVRHVRAEQTPPTPNSAHEDLVQSGNSPRHGRDHSIPGQSYCLLRLTSLEVQDPERFFPTSKASSWLRLQTALFIIYLEISAFWWVCLPRSFGLLYQHFPPRLYIITLSAPSGITLWPNIWGGKCPFFLRLNKQKA